MKKPNQPHTIHEDTVLEERILLPGKDMSKLAVGPVLHDADGCVLVEKTQPNPQYEAFVWHSPVPRDFTPFDRIDLALDVDAPEWKVSLVVELRSRTTGTGTHDNYYVGTPGTRTDRGSFRYEMPIENFNVHGVAPGWKEVQAIRFDVWAPQGGRIRVGPLRLVRRQRVTGPRMTDEAFFSHELDWSHPGLEGTHASVEKGDLGEASDRLCRYYAARKTVRHEFAAVPPDEHTADLDTARRMTQGDFGEIRVDPDDFDWRVNSAGYQEAQHWLNRHFFFKCLLHAWQTTGERLFLERINRWLARWMRDGPEPAGMDDGGIGPLWQTLTAACRIARVWPYVFFSTLGNPAFENRTRVDMLKSWLAHARHLMRWRGAPNNWAIHEASALAVTGILFPELKSAHPFREEGLARLLAEGERQVWPDGVQKEVSVTYHWGNCGKSFALSADLAQANDVPVPHGLPNLVERMAEYPMYLRRPDGSMPSFNDSGPADGRHPDALKYAAARFGRADMRFVLSDGREGNAPADASHAFPDAGVYVMRSGWRRDANYLAFRGGRVGAAHSHEETGTFDLCAYGSPIVVEPGIHSYAHTPMVKHFRSSFASNVLTVNGLPHRNASRSREHRTASVRGLNYWHSGPAMDVAAMRNSGVFGGETEGGGQVLHQREFHFVKGGRRRRPELWVMVDTVRAERRCVANLFFHFMPMTVCIRGDPPSVRTDRRNESNLEIRPLNLPPGAEIVSWNGSLDPLQGWVALSGHAEAVPSPCVAVNVPFDRRLCLVSLLLPYAAGDDRRFRTKTVSEQAFAVELASWAAIVRIDFPETFDVSTDVAAPVARVELDE